MKKLSSDHVALFIVGSERRSARRRAALFAMGLAVALAVAFAAGQRPKRR